ncbi:hypothetical protein EVAR_37185_1 [Eumeta japonica]|uniref:Uncharacterized protein n=1 Tax=Eumeta variegata TaxID=151549 RepID=A0A4C1WLL0_EUMVA|nr:hypothetical protein EVAR_37185_1 [Eumeta japonica]
MALQKFKNAPKLQLPSLSLDRVRCKAEERSCRTLSCIMSRRRLYRIKNAAVQNEMDTPAASRAHLARPPRPPPAALRRRLRRHKPTSSIGGRLFSRDIARRPAAPRGSLSTVHSTLILYSGARAAPRLTSRQIFRVLLLPPMSLRGLSRGARPMQPPASPAAAAAPRERRDATSQPALDDDAPSV